MTNQREVVMRFAGLFTIAILLMSAVSMSAQDNRVDFSGEWVLNTDKSDLGRGPRGRGGGMSPSKLIIEQKENQLVVKAFRKNRSGEDVTTESTYALDGKKSENKRGFGKQVSVTEWSEDGQTLKISSTMTMSRGDRKFTMESTETWALSKSTLIIETTRSTPMGEMTSKLVYEKAQEPE